MFILFPCQLPHDETIRYHSDVSVEKALSAVILAIKETNMLIDHQSSSKSAAMKSLYDIYLHYKENWHNNINCQLLWIDNISIHSLIKNHKLFLPLIVE